jgi:hypothetical protein
MKNTSSDFSSAFFGVGVGSGVGDGTGAAGSGLCVSSAGLRLHRKHA